MQNEPDPLAPPADIPATPQPAAPAVPPAPATPVAPAASPQQPPVPRMPRKDNSKIIFIVVIAVVSVIALTFIILFIWKAVEWNDLNTDVQSKIDKAVSDATMALETKKENEFAEREKYPYNTFTAPEDYGGLSFEYPKTWSVYVAKSAEENKGDFEAYLNPGVVSPISATTINATRVTIKNQTFEKTIAEYEKLVEKGKMSMSVHTLNNDNYPAVKGDTYNLYRGELPSKLRGAVAVFKVRDKSFILQTDAEVFMGEGDQGDFFRPVLETVHYNK